MLGFGWFGRPTGFGDITKGPGDNNCHSVVGYEENGNLPSTSQHQPQSNQQQQNDQLQSSSTTNQQQLASKATTKMALCGKWFASPEQSLISPSPQQQQLQQNGFGEEEENASNPLLRLPLNVLTQILSHLTPSQLCLGASLTCRQLFLASRQPRLWRQVDFNPTKAIELAFNSKKDEDQRQLRRCIAAFAEVLPTVSSGVRTLSYFIGRDTPFPPHPFGGGCVLARLVHLDLGFNSALDVTALDEIIDASPNVKRVNLEGVNMINDVTIEMVLLGWPQLTDVCLSHCEKLSDKGVTLLAEKCKQLVRLNIDGVQNVTDCGVESICDKHNATLIELHLDGAELSDRALFYLRKCEVLHTLKVSFAENFTDVGLLYLRDIPTLTHVHLRKASELTCEGLIGLFESTRWRCVKWLHLAECNCLNDEVVEALTGCCVQLEALCLSWCWSVTEKGLNYIIKRLDKLRLLDVVGLDLIKGAQLAKVPQTCLKELRFLDVRQCNLIEDDTLRAMVSRSDGQIVVVNYYGEVWQTANGPLKVTNDSRLSERDAAKRLLNGETGACCMTSSV